MIPTISKLSNTNENYKYGFRWSVNARGYTLLVRTFKRAFKFWKQEIKKIIS